jgi:hypothetical protein
VQAKSLKHHKPLVMENLAPIDPGDDYHRRRPTMTEQQSQYLKMTERLSQHAKLDPN